MSRTTHYREMVLNLIRDERARQETDHGSTNPILEMGFGGSVPAYPWLMPYSDADSRSIEAAFRADYGEYTNTHGLPTWMHLIREEVAELFDTQTSSHAMEEAVQVAALCASLCGQLLAKQEGDPTVSDLGISDANRMLIYRAYDDGDGNTLTLEPTGEPEGWFVGKWDGDPVMEGVERNGTLYSVCPMSGGGLVAVLVGRQIVQNEIGVTFTSTAEARAYVQGLTAK